MHDINLLIDIGFFPPPHGLLTKGEGRMALFRLTRDPSFFDGGIDPCWQNDHPAVFGFGDDRPSSLGAKDGKGTLGDPPL